MGDEQEPQDMFAQPISRFPIFQHRVERFFCQDNHPCYAEMMSDTNTIKHLRAVYENGVFRPLEPVILDEHREVTLSVINEQPYPTKGDGKTCLDLAKELGLIGIVENAHPDLSTNKAHFEGFGQ